ncbi:MAG: 16S rRNA (adenine(1518)-N(6)/adenine(1519)-N(6))-dimethyltransferase RsmA [Tissierellia bacterium]|nr:16S rRNA (adenine(1518)-N(6)/adenine(1519)-N(6))-dimethyltransferase RsmA [Tissierellia bacterium]
MKPEHHRLYRPSVLKEVLEAHGFSFTKSLGQNFLIDGNIINKIVRGAEITKEDNVLEIGTGIGTLTEELALRGKKVLAFEIDKGLEPILKDTLQDFSNIHIVFEDILKAEVKDIVTKEFGEEPFKVVANLPYYVTTPILGKLLEEDLNISSITVMVQKEVGQRMVAKPGSKDYGSLSVFIQFFTNPSIITKVPKTVFLPKPKVDSIVLRMDVKEPIIGIEKDKFFRIVKAAFSKRRKTIINALSTYGLPVDKREIRHALETSNIHEGRRGEELTVDEFIVLSINFPNIGT